MARLIVAYTLWCAWRDRKKPPALTWQKPPAVPPWMFDTLNERVTAYASMGWITPETAMEILRGA